MSTYIGVDGIARKVKNSYIGVDGLARKITKAYLGVDGVARPFFNFSGGGVSYYGAAEDLSIARTYLAATSIGDYALFAGGKFWRAVSTYYNSYSTVDAYDINLVHTIPTPLTIGRNAIAATSLNDYALFGGGDTNLQYGSTNRIDVYDKSLTTTSKSLTYNVIGLAATTIGDYALFGGGYTAGNPNTHRTNVDAIDGSLVRSKVSSDLSEKKQKHSAASVGDYAIFAGGMYSYALSSTDAYDKALTKTTAPSLADARYSQAAVSMDNYALFAGGIYSASGITASRQDTINAFDKALTRTTLKLSKARNGLAGTTIGNYALFAGGNPGDGAYTDLVDVYDDSLTLVSNLSLSVARTEMAATSIGYYAIFAGGFTANVNDAQVSTVDVFTTT